MVEQGRMLDCQGWWAEQEAPLGVGLAKGAWEVLRLLGELQRGLWGSGRGDQPGQGAVRNNGRDCEEVGLGGVVGEAGRRAGRGGEGIIRWVRESGNRALSGQGHMHTQGQGPRGIRRKDWGFLRFLGGEC